MYNMFNHLVLSKVLGKLAILCQFVNKNICNIVEVIIAIDFLP